MKKTTFLHVLSVLLLAAAPAHGGSAAGEGGFQGDSQDGGFSGPGLTLSTVQQAKSLRDDSPVVLRGAIIRHLGKDKYLFRDQTGSVRLEIDRDKWPGLDDFLTPQDTIEIQGEIDRDRDGLEIEVHYLIMLK